MIIDTRIVYELKVLMPKARNAREVAIRDTHPVQIQEVDDAVLVAEIDADGWFAEHGEVPRHKVYMIDGEFWATTFRNDRGEDSRTLMTADLYRELVDKGHEAHVPGMAVVGSKIERYGIDHFDSVEAVGAREIVSSTRDKVCETFDGVASGLRVFDGMMLRRVSEPVYLIQWSSHQGRHTLWTRHVFLQQALGEATGRGSGTPSNVWRLDRFDAMMAAMQRVRTSDDLSDARPANVHRPDLLSWDRLHRVVINSFNRDLDLYRERRDGFKDESLEVFAAYAAIRDHGHLQVGAADEGIAHAMSLARELHARLGVAGPGSGPFHRSIAAHQELLADRRLDEADDAIIGSLRVP